MTSKPQPTTGSQKEIIVKMYKSIKFKDLLFNAA